MTSTDPNTSHTLNGRPGPIERVTLPLVPRDARHVGQSGNVVQPLDAGQASGRHRRLDPGEIADPRPVPSSRPVPRPARTPCPDPAPAETEGQDRGPPASSISTWTFPPRRPFTSTTRGPSGVSFRSTLAKPSVMPTAAHRCLGDGEQLRLGRRVDVARQEASPAAEGRCVRELARGGQMPDPTRPGPTARPRCRRRSLRR